MKERKRKREKYAEKVKHRQHAVPPETVGHIGLNHCVCLQKKNEESESKKRKDVNLVIAHAPSADNSNLSADGDDSFVSVDMDSALPSPFSEVTPTSSPSFNPWLP